MTNLDLPRHTALHNATSRLVDAVLEGPVVPSFSRIGYAVRSRTADWTSVVEYDMTGRVVLITGATSGLGAAAAYSLVARGAAVILLGRDADRTAAARSDLLADLPDANVSTVIADMAERAQVRDAAARLLDDHPRLDVILHNAGALAADRSTNSEGVEVTVAAQVVGPFLLTSLLLDRLAATAPARVVTVSSGGMYTTGLHVDDLEMGDDYRGTEQYARAKRAQVTLNEMWAQRWDREGRVRFHAMHPGWADTPGVAASLPTFRKVMRPLLRKVDQGADTMVWLAADDGEPLSTNGLFWLDRAPRPIHKLPKTKRSDTPEQRERLWRWVEERALGG